MNLGLDELTAGHAGAEGLYDQAGLQVDPVEGREKREI